MLPKEAETLTSLAVMVAIFSGSVRAHARRERKGKSCDCSPRIQVTVFARIMNRGSTVASGILLTRNKGHERKGGGPA